ncbi:DUF6119 family protein [Nocardia sp. NPDC005978]|uniref:DUF6119 family protein n=1 Tax=Nocardia sp. NPDC005978 TaxID=3156725 RepID=UPI00339F5786
MAYDEQISGDASKMPLRTIATQQLVDGVHLALYGRPWSSEGLLPLIRGFLTDPGDADFFQNEGADGLLFISTATSLFVITSGAGYHIITDFVDYDFPFETAKRLVSNSFTAADVRTMTGSILSRAETYRRVYTIDRSEAIDAVWTKLVGKLDAELLPADCPIRDIINPAKPPVVEIKSSFVLRQMFDLPEICRIVRYLEVLPEPTDEQRRNLSFLDNLHLVKGDKRLLDRLTGEFVDGIRRALLAGEVPDIDVQDPADVGQFLTGSDYRLGSEPLGDATPGIAELLPALHRAVNDDLASCDGFRTAFLKLSFGYRADANGDAPHVTHKLVDFFHGQVDLDGFAYFRLNKKWYRGMGDYLDNLKRDFVDEVFHADKPLFLGAEVQFLPWNGGDENAFNLKQAEQPDFYFGDRVYAWEGRGRVELFDLIKVDEGNKKLYIIHTKKDFNAPIREACAQILLSADMIARDRDNNKEVLRRYYEMSWSRVEVNAGVDVETFLGWFEYDLVFVVLCSTLRPFTAEEFTKNTLHSHFARREILSAKAEMKSRGRIFRLAHTIHGA